MAYTQAQNKATQRYQQKNLEQIAIRVPKGERQALKAESEAHDLTMSQYIAKAVNTYAGKQILTDTSEK